MNFSAVWIFVIVGACLVSGACRKKPVNSRFTISDSYTKFASQLVDTIANNSSTDNFVVSPLSLAQILTIASYGASGKTLKELRQVLHIPKSNNGNFNREVLKASQELIKRLQKEKCVNVKLLNRIYIQRNQFIKGKFEMSKYDKRNTEIRNYLNSIMKRVNFTRNGEKIAKEVNDYVKNNTRGTIKNIVKPDMFNSNTKMVAINVLYFQSEWYGFSRMHKSQNFYAENGRIIRTPMISKTQYFKYYNEESLQIVTIPFHNKKFEMTLVMANQNPSLSEALKLINEKKNIGQAYLHLEIPKFVIESEHNLIETMKTMGVKRMFSDSAEFPIFNDGKGKIRVSSLIQKSYINVTETGVEASASTLMDHTLLSGEPYPKLVRFNRPFFAYITYEWMPLFAMRVTNPGHWIDKFQRTI